jgi:hypothetical protein
MSKIALDLNEFKHVDSDDESTTLQHKNGHVLKLSHGGMAKEAVAALKALSASAKKPSDKGEAKQEEKKSGTIIVDNAAKGLQQAKILHKEKAAPHGAVVVVEPKKKYADGGKVKNEEHIEIKRLRRDPVGRDKAAYNIHTNADHPHRKDRGQPVTIGRHVDTGDLHVLNGYHRIAEAEKAGHTHIKANVVPTQGVYFREGTYDENYQHKEPKKKYADGTTNVKEEPSIIEKFKHAFDEPTPTPNPRKIRPPMETNPKATKSIENYFNTGKEEYADGGQVMTPEQEEQHLQVAKQIMAKRQQKSKTTTGSKPVESAVRQYAEGTPEIEADPNKFRSEMPQPPAIEAIKEPTIQQDPDLIRKHELYNQYVSGSGIPTGQTEPDYRKASQFGPKGEPPVQFDPNSWAMAEKAFAQNKAAEGEQAAAAQQAVIKENQARAAAGLPLKQIPNVPSEPQVPGSEMHPAPQQPDQLPQQVIKQVDQPKQQQPAGVYDTEGMMQQGLAQRLSGITEGEKALRDLGQAQEKVLQNRIDVQDAAQTAYKKQYDALEQERQAHMADIDAGHIDPNRYWTGDPKTGEGGHSKIMAGIGMILAGFNPTNNPNAAINFLKFQMEQNLEAQKQNLAAKQNLLSANLRQFGNLKDATDMTRLMQNDIMQKQLEQAAAAAKAPQAKAAALQAAGALRMEAAPIFQNFAMRRAMMQLGQQGHEGDPSNTAAAEQMIAYMRPINPEMAKQYEQLLVPSVGMAKIPVPADVRSEIIGKQTFDKMAQHYVDWVKQNAGSLNPAKIREGAAMAADLQGAYRQASKGGVYKEGEQAFIEQLIPSDPAQFIASIRTLPKLKSLMQSNQGQLNTLKQGYGLPQQAPAPQIKIVNGVKYMRGPKGEAIPVK